VAVIVRIIQRFQTGKRKEFMELEKQFAGLEQQGVLLKGERMTPLASREPGNTLIWQGKFRDMSAAQDALRHFENSPDHTRLYDEQKQYMGDTWVEFYESLDF
jgi:hypothetical protein